MLTSRGQHRYEELDSLRGLAALVVAVSHVFLFWNRPYPHWRVLLSQSPFGLLIDGPDAVYVFFVLSGFVLFLPYLRPVGPGPYRDYLIKRICRIYLPYLVALGLAIAADLLFYRPGVTAMFPDWDNWHRPFPTHAVWQHLAFVWQPNLIEFSTTFWTLGQEIRLSIVYPLIAFLALRLSLFRGYLVSVAICFTGFFLAEHFHVFDLRTIGYGGLFVMGALVARHLPEIRSFMDARGWFGRSMVFVVSIAFYKSTHLLPQKYYQFWAIVPLHGTGAILILVLALTTVHFKQFLHLGPLHWLGKISYSLYLLHAMVFYSLASVYWTRTTHHILLLLGGLAFSLVLSAGFYHWVERPSILLGRLLTRREPATVVVPTAV
jgi:peptidoglycan/LPS O-acetylase OafA/YrhL